ncbi:cytidylyltransferase domain-containing protein [Aestuariispira insulae]|uniref:N-acylneuraminate cytidylyltransferase/CMP-N,N'-diacetyllegionaminic acid synthase n=1 Tax=Aestuariispira insulae TaxID=1461337 RepID=A0A3D9H493_9PROT|nr:acylneuraminate cytidylyltransferase family protein [Aestuariispira insulae]RED44290.1 N-acylneuraminate cytidylyltransferase/CMP-N,N'-diacetyllegionaminic acid synthase [Aestuariispira insulae]
MIENKKVLVVITARGGSKGLPGKNIKPLMGKPLIAYTIEAARDSHYVDRIIVSSDSQDIVDTAVAYGAEAPFIRPESLAGDLSKQEDAILHAMDWVEAEEGAYDYVMVLVPTTPLRDAAEVDACLEALVENDDAKAIFTVRECDHHPWQANALPESQSMRDFIDPAIRTKNRQELPQFFQLSGSVCLSEWEHFRKEQSFLTDKTFAYLTDARNGLDIDNLKDFLLAEVYLNNPGLV